MAGGSASREIESVVSTRGGQNRNIAIARRRRCVRARVAAERRTGFAVDSSRRRTDELDHLRPHLAATVGVLLGRKRGSPGGIARTISRWLLRGFRRRCLLRITQ